MKQIHKWMLLNGTYVALAEGNVLVGYIIPIGKDNPSAETNRKDDRA